MSAAVAHYCASVDSRCPICCLGTCLLQGVIGRLSICFLAAVRLNPFIPIHFVYFPMTGGPPRSAVKNWVNQQVHEQKRCSVLGTRCPVPGARCSVVGARCSVLGARCSVSGATASGRDVDTRRRKVHAACLNYSVIKGITGLLALFLGCIVVRV